ncbi:Pyrroline-5-carboxylate reductase [hydrothermal vent metagenome]|uniref:Pyrroline-5-carboxylate reductase n=1 Tax=hydrothermal vent metagenome TaxID=652676 RepID=A0A1W1EJ56_9ZZZZ
MKKLITIIGNGNMALSIAKGLQKDYDLEVIGRSIDKLDKFELNLDIKIQKKLLKDFDITNKDIILSVKPYNILEVGEIVKGEATVIYSVLAGTTIETLSNNINAKHYIRTMPNLGASVGESMTTITGDITYKDEAEKLFNAIGTTRWLDTQKELDIATALAGSGPAYLTLIAEALADGAVKEGLKRDDAMAVMRGLFKGFGELIQTQHPAIIKDAVMSPAGTTAYGYGALEDGAVRGSCINAITKAYNRAKELS